MKLAHILCPVDFSDVSTHAIDLATVIAGWYHARLTVLFVHTPMLLAVPMPARASGPVHEDRGAIERQRLTDTVRAFAVSPVNAGIDVHALVDMGQPAVRILACESELHVDLIVMGTHGTSGFQHLMLGSVTERVIRQASCPVLTVPPRVHAASQLPPKHILCPIDFSESSLSALAWAWSLARESGAGVSLLHVVEWPWQEPPAPQFEELPPDESRKLVEFRREVETRSQARLQSLVPHNIRDAGQSNTLVRHGKAHREVLAAAAACRADLIVMGVHGRNVVDLALFGSTTNQVVRSAACPVLTVRARPSR